MSGFNIDETFRYHNGKLVEHTQITTCSECNARLYSSEDWSRHRAMHTKITDFDRQCWMPRENKPCE